MIAPVGAVQSAVLSSVLRRVREDLCNIYEMRFRKQNVVTVHEGSEIMWSARERNTEREISEEKTNTNYQSPWLR